jgi:hypothetical protein
MHGVAAGTTGNVHQFVDPEITLARGRSTDRIRFIGEANVQRSAVGDTINGGRLYAHLAAGSYDANGYFAAIGNEDFFEHAPSILPECILAR